MNVLLASYWSYPATGAIDIYLRKLSSELERGGNRAMILARNGWDQLRLVPGGTQCDLRAIGRTIIPGLWSHFGTEYPLPADWVMQREGEQYVYEVGALRLCAGLDVDLVHAHDVHSARAMRRVFAERIPVVLTTHGLLAYEWLVEKRIPGDISMEWRYTFIRERAGIFGSAMAITPSEWMAQQYRQVFGVPPDRLRVIPYGFDTASYWSGALQRPHEVPSLVGRKVITCVARLVPLKGHDCLLDALVHVVRQEPEVLCLLVGDGPDEPNIRRAITAKGLERTVVLLGRRDDVPAILGATDIFVLPSLHEVTPLAISEAQLLGKPVVASAVGGVPELIEDGRTGLLVPPGDPTALSQALVRVLKDDGLAKRLGRSALQEVAKSRTWERHYTRLLGLYDEVLWSDSHGTRTRSRA